MPINSDISNSNVIPGVFGQIDLRSGSGSLGGIHTEITFDDLGEPCET